MDHIAGVETRKIVEPSAAAVQRAIAVRAMTHIIGSAANKDALDIACGDGVIARWLAMHGAKVHALEESSEMLAEARRIESEEPLGITYITADPTDMFEFEDASFDLVTCCMSLGRIDNLSALVAETARVIRLGGRFVFAVSHPCFNIEADSPNQHDYFIEDKKNGDPNGSKHRTISTYFNTLSARGFTVRRVIEPSAEGRDVLVYPPAKKWLKTPVALAVEAVFPKI